MTDAAVPLVERLNEDLRNQIADCLNLVEVYASHAKAFCTIPDDRGTEYTVKKAAANLSMAVDLLADLKKRVRTQEKEEAFAAARPVRIK